MKKNIVENSEHTVVRKIRCGAHSGSHRGQDTLRKKSKVGSSELPCSKQLNTLSVRFLGRKGTKKLCVSPLEIRTGCISDKFV